MDSHNLEMNQLPKDKLKRIEARSRRVALRNEAVRLHVEENVSNSEIARRFGIWPWQTQQWLVKAGVFKRNKQAGYKQIGIMPRGVRKPEEKLRSEIVKSWRAEASAEKVAWNIIDRAWNFRLCKECDSLFTQRGAGVFCGQDCRTIFYLRENREVLSLKAKSKNSSLAQAKAESAYAAKNPTCQHCHQAIAFLKFKRSPYVKFCSKQCGQKSHAADCISDPIKASNRKLVRQRCYAKRQLNGKNLAEKRKYYQNNVQAVIAKNLRTRLYQAVKKAGGKKSASTLELTGADWPTLAAWLQNLFQPGMNWNNYGFWHVDHKRPCAAFDLTKIEQQRECFHYTNLQPLWEIDNIKKGDKIIPALLAA